MTAEPVLVRLADPTDLTYIDSLQRANRESVGFLPLPALQERITRRTFGLACINNDPVGYLMWDKRGTIIRIPQACIQYDARRTAQGIALVTWAETTHWGHYNEIRLRCAADIEANLFWQSLGFGCIGQVIGGARRKRILNLWIKEQGLLIPTPRVQPLAQLRHDTPYETTGFLDGIPDGYTDGGDLEPISFAAHSFKTKPKASTDEQLTLIPTTT